MSLDGLALRSLRARPLRTALSILGVALGVAVLFAGLATNAGIEASIDGTVRELVGRADLRVAAFGEFGLSGATVTTIAGTPGVAVAAPALERRTYLIPDLAAGTALPPPVTVLGIDPAVDGAGPRSDPGGRFAACAPPTSRARSSPSGWPRRTG